MPKIENYIQRHRPLITPRIEFQLSPRPVFPVITPRIEFTPERLRQFSNSEPVIPNGSGSVTLSYDDDKSDLSDLTPSSSRSSSTVPTTPTKDFKKPQGEPGRPNSGGFSLEAVLTSKYQWSTKDYDAFMDYVDKEARRRLDLKVCYTSQNEEYIDEICDKASQPHSWPDVSRFDECWPVRSALKMILKTKSEAARRKGKAVSCKGTKKMATRRKTNVRDERGSSQEM